MDRKWIMMRFYLVAFFVFTFCLQVSADSYAQYTVKAQREALKKVMHEIETQSGMIFMYNNTLLKKANPVDLDVKNASLDQLLVKLFANQPIDYKVIDKTIVLSDRPVQTTSGAGAAQASIVKDISGQVLDENGDPLPGVTVRVTDSPKGIATDINGRFILTGVEEQAVVQISIIGYEAQFIKVSDRNWPLIVKMKPLSTTLNEVVTIAYGSTSKRLLTGAVSSVKADELAKQPVSNPLSALQGRMPGVYVNDATGTAGGAVSVQIRGTNTLSAGRNPLYIVDGVAFNPTATEQSAGTFTGVISLPGGLSPLDNIPPGSIEDITVLKDADATAIYGSRGANGVVLITTKKGKAGNMRVSANLFSGVSAVSDRVSVLSTDQYLSMRRQAFANDGITPTAASASDLFNFGNGQTNFVDYLLGKKARFTDGTVDISGGNAQTQYLVSANYRYQSTNLPTNVADSKGTIRFNLQSQSANGKFSLALTGAYTKNVNDVPSAIYLGYYSLPPNLPLYKADGSYYWDASFNNPAATLLAKASSVTDNILGNATLKYANIIPGLTFKTDFGFSRINVNITQLSPILSKNPAFATTGTAVFNNSYNQTYSIEPQLTYKHKLGPGMLDALVGGTYQDRLFVQPLFVFGSYTNESLATNLASVTPFIVSNGYIYNKFLSAFARLSYNIGDQFLFNFSGRRDGSSRFGPGKRFGNFGSAAFSWVFSQQSWVKDNLSWLSFGKLRTSYGTVGNDQIQDYGYLSTYSSGGLYSSYAGVNFLQPTRLANPDYSWETTKKLEFGVDLGFFNNRLNLSVDYYRNRSDNQLINFPVATQTGFGSFQANLGAVIQNTGVEVNVESSNIVKKDFSWKTGFNISAPRNKLIAFPGLASSSFANSYVVGQPVSVVQAYKFTGFDNTGIAQFQDLDGNHSIDAGSYAVTGKGDQYVVGYTDPKLYGGLNNTFIYKGLQLDFLFQFVQKDAYNILRNTVVPGTNNNVVSQVLDYPFRYTTSAGTAAGLGFSRYAASDQTFTSASFVRLKNVSLSYKFGDAVIRSLGIANLMVYFRGQNLLTLTNYLGFDPENASTLPIPPLKLYSVGLQASF